MTSPKKLEQNCSGPPPPTTSPTHPYATKHALGLTLSTPGLVVLVKLLELPQIRGCSWPQGSVLKQTRPLSSHRQWLVSGPRLRRRPRQSHRTWCHVGWLVSAISCFLSLTGVVCVRCALAVQLWPVHRFQVKPAAAHCAVSPPSPSLRHHSGFTQLTSYLFTLKTFKRSQNWISSS